MNETPKSIYKYLSPTRTLDLLNSLLIRFSQVSVLNDATEFKPPTKGFASPTAAKELLRQKLIAEGFPSKELSDALKGLPPEVGDRIKEQAIALMESHLVGLMEMTFPLVEKKIYEALDKDAGILSLSETPSNTLLWSHYAEGGRGFLIQFDPAHPWFWAQRSENDELRHLHRVTYESDRAQKYLLDTNGNDILYTKGKDWTYEQEWRILRSFDEAAKNLGPDKNGKDIFLLAIPAKSICGIVIGYRANSDSVAEIRSIVDRNPALSHISFTKAKMREDGEIEIVPYSP
jgi:hypothetical protein